MKNATLKAKYSDMSKHKHIPYVWFSEFSYRIPIQGTLKLHAVHLSGWLRYHPEAVVSRVTIFIIDQILLE